MTVHILVNKSLVQEEKNLITRMMDFLETKDFDITNVASYFPPATKSKEDVYLSFGKMPVYKVGHIVELPEIDKLHNVPGNEVQREIAIGKLKALRSHLDAVKSVVSIDELPSFSSEELLLIYKENNILGLTLFGKNGKTFRISFTSEDKEIADINMTFHELLSIKVAHEIFGIQSFTTQEKK